MSKWLRDLNCQDVKIVKGPKCQEFEGSPKRSKGPRDPYYLSYQEIQLSKSFPEKSTLSKVELSSQLYFLYKAH